MSDIDEAKIARVVAQLRGGNRRFLAGTPTLMHRDLARVGELAAGQQPRACVLACADSRVVPELIFDQGIGDLFVVRNAGACPTATAIASIQYALSTLNAPLAVVLAHSHCGAVKAARDLVEAKLADKVPHFDDPEEPHSSELDRYIADLGSHLNVDTDHVDYPMVEYFADMLRHHPSLARLPLIGARVRAAGYSVESGEVTWF